MSSRLYYDPAAKAAAAREQLPQKQRSRHFISMHSDDDDSSTTEEEVIAVALEPTPAALESVFRIPTPPPRPKADNEVPEDTHLPVLASPQPAKLIAPRFIYTTVLPPFPTLLGGEERPATPELDDEMSISDDDEWYSDVDADSDDEADMIQSHLFHLNPMFGWTSELERSECNDDDNECNDDENECDDDDDSMPDLISEDSDDRDDRDASKEATNFFSESALQFESHIESLLREMWKGASATASATASANNESEGPPPPPTSVWESWPEFPIEWEDAYGDSFEEDVSTAPVWGDKEAADSFEWPTSSFEWPTSSFEYTPEFTPKQPEWSEPMFPETYDFDAEAHFLPKVYYNQPAADVSTYDVLLSQMEAGMLSDVAARNSETTNTAVLNEAIALCDELLSDCDGVTDNDLLDDAIAMCNELLELECRETTTFKPSAAGRKHKTD